MRPKFFFVLFACSLLAGNLAFAQNDIATVPGLPASVTHAQLKASEAFLNGHSRISLSNSRDAGKFQPDTAHYAFIDTNRINFKWWPSSFGADLFLSGEFYGFHLGEKGAVTSVAGPGLEIRIRPFLVGVMVGFRGSEGIPDFPYGTYSFSSLHAGVTVHDYRIEIGQIYGDNSM